MTLVCCCLSVFNPILLVNYYEGAKERTRRMAKAMDKNTTVQLKKTKEIKEQWTSFLRIEHGLEAFYQVAGQIILLIFAKTETSTTGGLQSVFNQQNGFLGIQNPIAALAISIAITLKSCITLHLKTVKTEKQFVPFTSTFFILLWGLFSSLRSIISMVCLFIPSLGLFSCLYHHRAEQKPFSIWQRYGKTQMDKIVLYGLNETVTWGEIDRWDYST